MRVSKFITEILGAVAVFGMVFAASPALSADVRAEGAAALIAQSLESQINSSLTISASESVVVGYLTPAKRSAAFGALLGEPFVADGLNGMTGGLALTDAFDIAGKYTADLYGGRIGVYGGYADRPSTLSLVPDTAWSFGASVGFAGFYVRGGISDMTAVGYLQGVQGWEAGLGYETGSFDLRLTYAASQSASYLGTVERQLDSKQWALGGDYQITPRLRLNANAFYDMYNSGLPPLYVAPTMVTPQGTGARVGVQLRF